MIELDENKIANAMFVEIQSALWEVWLSNRYENYSSRYEHYRTRLFAMNETCRAFGIPAKVLFDDDFNGPHLPYGIEISGKAVEVFDRIRADYEQKISDPENPWNRLYGQAGTDEE